jgi:TolB-like protein
MASRWTRSTTWAPCRLRERASGGMAWSADSPRVSPVKRLNSLIATTLLLSTVAGAQTPAPAPGAAAPSSTPPAPVEASTSPQPAKPSADAVAPAPAPAAPVPAEGTATAKPDKDPQEIPTVAVLSLESNKAAEEVAPGIAPLIASRLAESPKLKVLSQRDIETVLSAERQRQLLGSERCASQGACLEELSHAIGARYMVTGRLDQFGEKFLLTVTLLDTVRGRSLARPKAEADSIDQLPQLADAIGEQLLAELAPVGKTAPATPLLGSAKETPGGGLVLGLRINNTFIDNLVALNPGADLELGYAFHPEWVGFVQVGISFLRSEEEGAQGRVRLVPSVLGARHYYRMEHSFRPYWGLGLGVQLSFGQFGPFKSTGPLPSVIGFFGGEYVIANRVGLHIEAGTNLAQATLGLVDNGLGDGLNLDLTAGVVFHF